VELQEIGEDAQVADLECEQKELWRCIQEPRGCSTGKLLFAGRTERQVGEGDF